MADDGYGIFEINTGSFFHIHQTVQPESWWSSVFSKRFVIDEQLSMQDFTYVRSRRSGGRLTYVADGGFDEYKILFWVRKQ